MQLENENGRITIETWNVIGGDYPDTLAIASVVLVYAYNSVENNPNNIVAKTFALCYYLTAGDTIDTPSKLAKQSRLFI